MNTNHVRHRDEALNWIPQEWVGDAQ